MSSAPSLTAQTPVESPVDSSLLFEVFTPVVPAAPFSSGGALRESAADSLRAFRAAAAEVSFVLPWQLRNGNHQSALGLGSDGPFLAWWTAAQRAVSVAGYGELLLPFLEDEDPRVRLMASYALYRSLDPQWLPRLGEMAADRSELPVLPQFAMNSFPMRGGSVDVERLDRRPIGDMIRDLIAGWGGPLPGMEQYPSWCARQVEFAPTAAALDLCARIACYGIGNTNHWPADRMLQAFTYCGRARSGLREIAQVALFHDRWHQMVGDYPLVEQQMTMGVRRLGRDNILRLLRQEAPRIDGAELAPEHYVGLEQRFSFWVLKRPGKVGLLPSDATELLQLAERYGGDLRWVRGAARLDPSRAAAVLLPAIAQDEIVTGGYDRTQCAKLLWDLRGVEQADRLAEWFYDVKPSPLRHTAGVHIDFLVHLLERYTWADRQLFRRIVQDDRFAGIAPQALLTLARSLDLTTSEQLLRVPGIPDPGGRWGNYSHPWGADRAFTHPEEARKAYPKETDKLLDELEQLRTAMRGVVASWPGDD